MGECENPYVGPHTQTQEKNDEHGRVGAFPILGIQMERNLGRIRFGAATSNHLGFTRETFCAARSNKNLNHGQNVLLDSFQSLSHTFGKAGCHKSVHGEGLSRLLRAHDRGCGYGYG